MAVGAHVVSVLMTSFLMGPALAAVSLGPGVWGLSALWLAAQTPLAAPLRGLLREEGRQAAPGQVQGDVERVLLVGFIVCYGLG